VSDLVRVLLLEMPPLLRGILEDAIHMHGDCELLKDSTDALAMALHPTAAPDIVILGMTAAEDATLVPGLFARWPQACVMTVMRAGDDATVYELRPSHGSLGEMSPEEIVDTLCDAVRHGRRFARENR
jgi:DNA-binding NarL/FixJ family response regulator